MAQDSEVYISSCLIYSNSANEKGGAFYFHLPSQKKRTNVTKFFNVSSS